MNNNKSKLDKFNDEYLHFISSDENSKDFLKEEGLDPELLADIAIGKVKIMQMKLASQATEKQYQNLKANLLQRAKEKVEELLNDVSFSLENFAKQENLNIAFKNFQKLSENEVRELLERHFLLKFENELRKKPNI